MTLQEMDEKARVAEKETRLVCALTPIKSKPLVSRCCLKLWYATGFLAFESVLVRIEEAMLCQKP